MNNNIENKKEENFICKSEILSRGWTQKLIKDFLPAPQYKRNPHYSSAANMQVWSEEAVINAENTAEFKAAYAKIEERRNKKRETVRTKEKNKAKVMMNSVESLIPANPIDEYPLARSIKRKFILHVGPTNSGKTHDSLEKLKAANRGAYLGPLRLLALEVFDRFNSDGVLCSMITGEEMIETPGATITASTIEMMNTTLRYDVVVVDEVQMIDDKYRGYNWTKAILGLYADEIHLCMAPEAEKITIQLINECGDSYEVVRHQRATELIFDESNVALDEIQPGDALIVFSRRSVLSLAADLETVGLKASVIYGNLPPASRREQVRRFNEGDTQVVVSTDAIGMGLNLPIRRIIFMETIKFDGVSRRKLLPQEIKQIAGRAGRFGMYEKGFVLSIDDKYHIKKCLSQETTPIQNAYLGFSEALANLPYSLPEITNAWSLLSPPILYNKMDLTEMLDLYNFLLRETNVISECTREEVYRMITCSVDQKNDSVVMLWFGYCRQYKTTSTLVFPVQRSAQLKDLEDYYKCLDLYYQFACKMKKPCDIEKLTKEKLRTEKEIGKILMKQKMSFKRRCRFCGETLPYNYPYGICESCYEHSEYYGNLYY